MPPTLRARDAEAVGDDPAGVAAFPCRAVHAVGRAAEEVPPGVVRHDRLDVVAEEVRLAFDDADDPDTELNKPPTHDEQVDRIAAEAVELVDVELVEQAGRRVAHEAAARGALGKGDRARDAVVEVGPVELGTGVPLERPGELVNLGLDRPALGLVLGADPRVAGNLSEPWYRHRHQLDPPFPRPGRTRGRPRTTRSAAAMASRVGAYTRSTSSDLASRGARTADSGVARSAAWQRASAG